MAEARGAGADFVARMVAPSERATVAPTGGAFAFAAETAGLCTAPEAAAAVVTGLVALTGSCAGYLACTSGWRAKRCATSAPAPASTSSRPAPQRTPGR